jgi:predicted ABC-type transport system involved in lysophospholipase L1 biosynthesis ATPase subunit
LYPVDVAVAAGACVALLGPNGSGKSTLLRLAAGRDAPSEGQVLFDGRQLSEQDVHARARIAVVADTSGYYPDLSVREHLLLTAVAHGAANADEWVDWALADRRLTEKADDLPSALSSGQIQALLLASALVRQSRWRSWSRSAWGSRSCSDAAAAAASSSALSAGAHKAPAAADPVVATCDTSAVARRRRTLGVRSGR